MLDRIIAFSIRYKFIVGMSIIALIAVGSYSMRNLPIDALPDITNNQVQILTTTPKLATQEVELFVTYPIERAVKPIPDITELRSVSRFGLSIVTVVFKEGVDIYWARNQISERLRRAREEIPEDFGSPELAPISTGLGEIYQYTVSAAEGYEDELDISDLRTIQDWFIVPELLGTKGVAEVNTLGGILKEYEVAVNPHKLNSMGITMAEIFDALKRSNENTGGAYIDKKPYAYFIRSIGLASSLDDVSKIVIKIIDGVPLLIRDVAEVHFGGAPRYGATTRDGQGEVVNGMVMMLKGANSAEVVRLVKEKLEVIKTTLPEGVVVEAYLDRSNLVNRAIKTVRTNLIEGALIVIFILVLLIGNWRAGLIVASVIPLSLLFAVTLMRVFGVSGNLMSLGAIDFGLIVDGAVIIVEAIVHRLQTRKFSAALTSSQMDEEVTIAASKIRKSAAFGEIIILIVYLPILTLVGIEGKMFVPMAQTVSFAILGAFILSLTYVPMMSALCLNRKMSQKKTLSDRIIGVFQRSYTPVLNTVMRAKPLFILLAVLLFAGALWLFSGLGGEFIPVLEEGDIAAHIIIPPGSSLEQEIETCLKAEALLKEKFPEMDILVSKIGSSEVPTDPMPMYLSDLLIILKDKSEWTSAETKEELIHKIEAVLDELPGVTTEFSQPVQMRFNELMTGIRSDVGVKIYGDDIEQLTALGEEVESVIQNIEGVVDIRAETVTGLPQINVEFDKDKLALYGLNVAALNETISTGFAGKSAGVIYEGEQKFNLVVRLAGEYRKDISHLENLYISLPSGNQIPLSQVANIGYRLGPAQISRENGRRRTIIGFNVRGRDVESAVEDIRSALKEEVDLPTGYYFEYAGQFENLQRARSRLMVAVPVALALIFTLLYFTFGSIIQSIMIFTAIPLSAIGGIVALYLRGMPFSISAGIGFIALFGVSVLNGIVLIGYFNQLKKEGMQDVMERIKKGTSVRLRPVIMTAAVASLGFLPMALSTSAGAEVQKPLATVVIGGLITSTLLTLVILPILYYYSEKMKGSRRVATNVLAVLMLFIWHPGSAQSNMTITSSEQLIEVAIDHNQYLQASRLGTQKFEQLREAPYLVPKTQINGRFGQMNTRLFDHYYSISQTFNPFESRAEKELLNHQLKQSQFRIEVDKKMLVLNLNQLWTSLQSNVKHLSILEEQLSLWSQFATFANRKYELGESSYLETTSAEIRSQTLEREIEQVESRIEGLKWNLRSLTYIDVYLEPDLSGYENISESIVIDSTMINLHPEVLQAQQEIEISKSKGNLLNARKKPDLSIGYFIQSIRGTDQVNGQLKSSNSVPRFHGVDVGLALPIFGKAYKVRRSVNDTELLIREAQQNQLRVQMKNQLGALVKEYNTLLDNIEFYKAAVLPNTELIVRNSRVSYESGEIGYLEYVLALDTMNEEKLKFLNLLESAWQIKHAIGYLSNQ